MSQVGEVATKKTATAGGFPDVEKSKKKGSPSPDRKWQGEPDTGAKRRARPLSLAGVHELQHKEQSSRDDGEGMLVKKRGKPGGGNLNKQSLKRRTRG